MTLLNVLKRRIAEKVIRDLSWNNITTAVGQAGQGEKNAIVSAVKRNDAAAVGEALLYIVRQAVDAHAAAQAQSLYDQGSITVAKLEELFVD